MRGEDEAVLRQAGMFENFRGVAMREKIVSLEIFIDLDEVEVATRIFAGAAGAGFAIAYYGAGRGDETGIGEGTKGQDDAGSVATGISDQACRRDFGGVQLRQAVHGIA